METLKDFLPLIFAGLMGLSMLIYAVLDGYDLGVGILIKSANAAEKDRMIGSIGPFWDANETWLVLGVGILLTAFPLAHGEILTNLYLPVALMLVGLIMRGVAFDFRVKAKIDHQNFWNNIFFSGSLLTAFAQGFMLGSYILGFEKSWNSLAFSTMSGFCVIAGYSLIGACWLIMKTENELQKKAIRWARFSLISTAIGIILISIVTPLVSQRIFDKWFSLPNIIFLMPIPIVSAILVLGIFYLLRQMPITSDRLCWMPFALTILLFTMCFFGLAYSFYPYIIPEKMTIFEAASAKESLLVIFFGVVVVFPILIAYTFFSYRIFRGKAEDLKYN